MLCAASIQTHKPQIGSVIQKANEGELGVGRDFW